MNLHKNTPKPLPKKSLFLMEDLTEAELKAMKEDFETSAKKMGIPLNELEEEDDKNGKDK